MLLIILIIHSYLSFSHIHWFTPLPTQHLSWFQKRNCAVVNKIEKNVKSCTSLIYTCTLFNMRGLFIQRMTHLKGSLKCCLHFKNSWLNPWISFSYYVCACAFCSVWFRLQIQIWGQAVRSIIGWSTTRGCFPSMLLEPLQLQCHWTERWDEATDSVPICLRQSRQL